MDSQTTWADTISNVALNVLSFLSRIFTTATLVRWFAEPLGFPHLKWPHLYGLMLVAWAVASGPIKARDLKVQTTSAEDRLAAMANIIWPLMYLGLGTIAKCLL